MKGHTIKTKEMKTTRLLTRIMRKLCGVAVREIRIIAETLGKQVYLRSNIDV